MNNKLLIRTLKKEDYLDVLALEKQVYAIHYAQRPDIYNDTDNILPKEYYYSLIDNPNYIALGIEIDEKRVAIILSEIKETNNIPVIKKRRFCLIEDLVVDKDYRKKGYATLLFNTLKEKVSKLGINNIELTVWSFNKEAIAFYEAIGMNIKNIRYELKI